MISACGSPLWFEAAETIVDLGDVDGFIKVPLEFSLAELLALRQTVVVEAGIDMGMLLMLIQV